MKFLQDEKNILTIIKYGAIIPMLIFSFIITNIFIDQKKQNLNKEIQLIRTNYLNENKKIIKNEIDNIINLINKERAKSKDNLKKQIKDRVYEAYRVANVIYNEETSKNHENGGHSKKSTFNTIKHALTGMSYDDDRGYFFIDDINGVKLLQPFNKEFEGKNLLEYADPNGYKFVKKISQTIKNKTEAFDEYYWFKPNDNKKAFEKISFYKYFAPYNVAIGTGQYVVNFEEKIKEKILEWVKNIRYSGNGYVFIYDLNGTCLSDIREECIGTNRLNVQNKKGDYVVKDILSFVKTNKKGFLNYQSTYSDKNQSPNKISYIELYKKWNWAIGTGFYLDNLNKVIKIRETELKNNSQLVINKIIKLSIIITLILIAISFYVSNMIAIKFRQYKKNIEEEIEKTLEKEKLLLQQSKMAVMGEMIGNIAHQWKQPLNLISMSNSLIKLNKENEGLYTEEQIDEALENIDNSVIHLSSTIDDFRNFFNPTKEKTYFNIKIIFDRTFKLMNSEFKNSNIEIIKNIKDINVVGYQNELLQVFMNILKNAKDEFVKKDTKEQQYLFIDVYDKNDFVNIKIKDTDGGIPDGIINDIFNPYFTTKKDTGGTGIGLYMCKQIMINMDGEITATNVEFEYNGNKYKGAQFNIKLPKNTDY